MAEILFQNADAAPLDKRAKNVDSVGRGEFLAEL